MAAACSKLSRGSWLYPVILYQVILLINLLQEIIPMQVIQKGPREGYYVGCSPM